MKNNTRLFLFVVGLGLSTTTYAQSTTENFVKSTECLDKNCTAKKEAVTYYDGLGREKLSIVKGAGSSATGGLATKITYDGFGRVDKEYLPGVVPNLSIAEPDYSAYPDPLVYSQKEYENSALNRVLKQAAPGGTWQLGNGKEIEFDYQTNTASEVLKFGVSNPTTTPTLTLSGKYAANQLYKTVTTDENGQPMEEFKDKEGKVLLKRIHIVSTGSNNSNGNHDTYYVYDVYGNLTFVLPPVLIKNANNSSTASSYINRLNELGYQYKYDDKNRLVEKKLPGKGWEYMVYDNQDRLVGTQDANQRTEGVWLFTKYDKFGRIAVTGKAWDPGTRTDVQNYINQLGSNNVSRGSGYQQDNIQIYYNTDGFGANNHVLSVYYYDDYPSYPLGVNTTANVQGHALAKGTKLKGLPTLTVTRSLDTWENNTWNFEYAYTLYDAQYLYVVKSHKVNYLGGHTIVENQLDFRGKPLQTITKHKRKSTDTEITVKESFSYDHFERLKNQTHQVNNSKVEVIAQNTYNAIGQLSQKKVGNSTSTPYQTVDYTYNIRGWLTDINNVHATPTMETGGKLFAFHISYDQLRYSAARTETARALYNGNISQTFWKTPAQSLRSYDYQYDGLNRLLNATFYKGTSTTQKNYYDEQLSYDHNGNITQVSRNGTTETGTPVLIDQLSYHYQQQSNKLLKVSDHSNHSEGFADGTNAGDDYVYDENGNLIQDLNKGISEIKYNYLNLPTEVIWNSSKRIQYAYDANGVKLRKVVTDGTRVTTTDYLGGFQYKNNDLQFFPTSEGYVNVVTNKVSGGRTYNYVYNYTDHLGNVRLSYAWDDTENKLKILEENHYYPFGLKHKGYQPLQQIIVTPGEDIASNRTTIEAKFGDIGIGIDNSISTGSATYNYKYQGQELQDELGLGWYSFKYRNYDPAIGRFFNVDPLSEKYAYQSHYNFAENKLGSGRELEGLELGPMLGIFYSEATLTLGTAQTGYYASAGSSFSTTMTATSAGLTSASGTVGASISTTGIPLDQTIQLQEATISSSSKGTFWDKIVDGVTSIGKSIGRVFNNDSNTAPEATDGEASQYENSTNKSKNGGRPTTKNRDTDVSKQEFEKNLENSGFEKSTSKDGKVSTFNKDGKSYSTRDNSSGGKPTAEFRKNADAKKPDLKIRLGE